MPSRVHWSRCPLLAVSLHKTTVLQRRGCCSGLAHSSPIGHGSKSQPVRKCCQHLLLRGQVSDPAGRKTATALGARLRAPLPRASPRACPCPPLCERCVLCQLTAQAQHALTTCRQVSCTAQQLHEGHVVAHARKRMTPCLCPSTEAPSAFCFLLLAGENVPDGRAAGVGAAAHRHRPLAACQPRVSSSPKLSSDQSKRRGVL